MIPNELCHYTKKDIALEKILDEGKIKLSQIGRTNDPKESIIDHSVSYFPSLTNKNADGYFFLINREFKKIQKEEWKVLCTTMHLPKQKHQNEVISKFRYGWSRPTMWAHYAGNHSGVCIVFNGKELHKNIQMSLGHYELFCGKVKYEKPSEPLYDFPSFQNIIKQQLNKDDLQDEIRKHLKKYRHKYFLSKFSAWKNESEYRFLAHSTNRGDELVDIQGAIKLILVGLNFPKVYEPTMEEIGKKFKISIGKMDWRNGIPYPRFSCIHNASK